MRSHIYKNLVIHSLWLFAAATALTIQPLAAQAQSYKVLYSFTKDSSAGQDPSSSLVRDPEGNLYGIALGGTFGQGIVFELSNNGQESVLHNFNQSDGDGDVPDSLSYGDSTAPFLAPHSRAEHTVSAPCSNWTLWGTKPLSTISVQKPLVQKEPILAGRLPPGTELFMESLTPAGITGARLPGVGPCSRSIMTAT
jgi:uncharacterized repeat protein (TIGR03803 family)